MVLKGIEISNASCIEEAVEEAKNHKYKPVVAIRCITYNHRDFISETLDGFVNQVTDFSFVAIVHDDASTDGTADIVKQYSIQYPNIIKGVCDTKNRYSEHTLGYIMDFIIDAYSPKYIAACEGDDYWTDPFKLQKQVDYMERHPDCVMCHGDYEIINGSKRKTPVEYYDEPYFGPGHKHDYSVSSLTALYRYDAYKAVPRYSYTKKWLMGDYPLWIELSRLGKFHYIPEVFGKYRLLANSASHSTNAEQIVRFWECGKEIEEFYSKIYGYEYRERSRKSLYSRIQFQCYKNHDTQQAKKYWVEAKKYKANSIKSAVFYFCNISNQRWIISVIYKLIG